MLFTIRKVWTKNVIWGEGWRTYICIVYTRTCTVYVVVGEGAAVARPCGKCEVTGTYIL